MTAPKSAGITGVRSAARIAFSDNSSDVRSFFNLHQGIKNIPGYRKHLNVANKGTYLLVAALWETYTEDLFVETVQHLVAAIGEPSRLPVDMSKAIARELKQNPHDLSPWLLAGDGWQTLAVDRARRMRDGSAFNTPKSAQLDELYWRGIGFESISSHWVSDRTTDPRAALDSHMERRGELAHVAASVTITKRDVSEFYQLVLDLTRSTDEALGDFLADLTGQNPYDIRDLPD